MRHKYERNKTRKTARFKTASDGEHGAQVEENDNVRKKENTNYLTSGVPVRRSLLESGTLHRRCL